MLGILPGYPGNLVSVIDAMRPDISEMGHVLGKFTLAASSVSLVAKSLRLAKASAEKAKAMRETWKNIAISLRLLLAFCKIATDGEDSDMGEEKLLVDLLGIFW